MYKLVIKWKNDEKNEIFLFEEDIVDWLSESYLGSFYSGQEIDFPKASVFIYNEILPGDEYRPWLDFKKLKNLFEYLSEE